jgi:hypothetical protein
MRWAGTRKHGYASDISDGEGLGSSDSDNDMMADRPDFFKKPMFMDQQQSMDLHTVPILDSTDDDMEELMGNESGVRAMMPCFASRACALSLSLSVCVCVCASACLPPSPSH